MSDGIGVYKAINRVQVELARTGISKDRKNAQQGYSFRGIDDMYNALSPVLGQHGLCILPRVLRRECVERMTAKGGTLFYVTVEMEFDFVAAEDGSRHVVKTFGEAMDSADKATNKAMSAAYKYAVMQAFAIPTEGDDNDADGQTHQVIPQTITVEQLEHIDQLLMESRVEVGVILKWLTEHVGWVVTSIETMPANAYGPLVKKLQTTISKKKETHA